MKKPTLLLFKIENFLGPLETEIIKTVWKNKKISVRQVFGIFNQDRSIAYTTLMTVMDNLYKKGFLKREKIKKSYYYSPVSNKNYVVDTSIKHIFVNLIASYGTLRVFRFAISSSLSYQFVKIVKFRNLPKIVLVYRTPFTYGTSFSLILVLLGYSFFDLFRNLRFFGVFDYLGLLISEPTLLKERLNLIAFALWESLPIINILTTVISFILVFVFTNKLLKLLDIKKLKFTNFAGTFS